MRTLLAAVLGALVVYTLARYTIVSIDRIEFHSPFRDCDCDLSEVGEGYED